MTNDEIIAIVVIIWIIIFFGVIIHSQHTLNEKVYNDIEKRLNRIEKKIR